MQEILLLKLDQVDKKINLKPQFAKRPQRTKTKIKSVDRTGSYFIITKPNMYLQKKDKEREMKKLNKMIRIRGVSEDKMQRDINKIPVQS